MIDHYRYGTTTRDHSFEPFLELRAQAAETVIKNVLPHCEATIVRKRQQKHKDADNFRRAFCLVLANALQAAEHSTNRRVHYSRKASTYSETTIYFPDWLGYTNLKNAVDAMAACNIIKTTKGTNDQTQSHFGTQPRSTFEVTGETLEWLARLAVTAGDVCKSKLAPVVILKDNNGKLIDFDQTTKYAQRLIQNVRQYNEFIKLFELSIALEEPELVALHSEKEKDGRPRPSIDVRNTSLRRVFNGTLAYGGRWFDGWWMNMPSRFRHAIRINGKETVELDFSGFNMRALYHMRGIDYREDPYELEAVFDSAEAQGLNWDSVRDSIKTLTNVLLNAGANTKIGTIDGLTLPKGYKRPNSVYPLIEVRHGPIRNNFRSGIGLALMRSESEICTNILLAGIQSAILVLPIHDSFIVQAGNEGWLFNTMLASYKALLRGFEPVIRKREDKEIRQINNNQLDDFTQVEDSQAASLGEIVVAESWGPDAELGS